MIEPQLFPYPSMSVRLEISEENRVCWFRDNYDLQKHLTRYKLDKKKIKIFYRDGEPIQQRKTNKRSVEQTPKPKSNRGSGTVRKRKSSVDSD
jgi:hypothetical protein